jgi:hypothetical protein
MNSSHDFQSIHVISFVISLRSILLIDFESGSQKLLRQTKQARLAYLLKPGFLVT